MDLLHCASSAKKENKAALLSKQKRICYFVFAGIHMLAAGVPAWAQKVAIAKLLAVPLNTDAERLPPNYQGHDCRRIVSALKKRLTPKGEYETTEAFNERIESAKQLPLYDNIYLPDTLALVRKSRLETYSKYDADKRILTVHPTVEGRNKFVDKELYTADSLEYLGVKESKYRAANAFGINVLVNKIETSGCYVAFPKPIYNIRFPLVLEIENIEPEAAQALKGKLEVIYVGTLDAPYIQELKEYETPTISSPQERIAAGDMLAINLNSIWVVNKTTGAVLSKYKRDGNWLKRE